MFSALLYLQYHTIKNRTLARFKRLKQPKYLIGAIVGGAYFYFYFFRYMLSSGRSATGTLSIGADEQRAFAELVGALVLFVVLVLTWVIPRNRAALTFTEAEIAFLFPAPITRRGLIHYKLLRSQAAIFFTVLLLTIITNRFGGRAGIHAIGWWLILSVISLHTLGASFARTMLLERGISNWQRRLWVLLAVVALGLGVFAWARRTLPPFDPESIGDLAAVKEYLEAALSTGPAYFVLLPFRWLIAPYLAPDPLSLLRALPLAVGMLLLHYFWVIQANVAFEEASVEASRKLAEKVASVRAGNWSASTAKKVRSPFQLSPVGPPAVALLWKNLICVGRGLSMRLWIVIAAVMIGAALGFGSGPGMGNPALFIGMFAAMFLVWSLLLGPQVVRQDFRQDLPLADLLKSYPLRGWQVGLGELLAPVVLLTAVQWLLLLAITFFLLPNKEIALGWPGNLAPCLGLALILPLLNIVSFLIPNAAVLLFPAWLQSGKEGPQGVEATGQRIIAMLAQFVVFLAALVPPALAFGLILFVVQLVLPLIIAVLMASIVAAVVLAIEAAAGVLWVGRLFERLDLSTESVS